MLRYQDDQISPDHQSEIQASEPEAYCRVRLLRRRRRHARRFGEMPA